MKILYKSGLNKWKFIQRVQILSRGMKVASTDIKKMFYFDRIDSLANQIIRS